MRILQYVIAIVVFLAVVSIPGLLRPRTAYKISAVCIIPRLIKVILLGVAAGYYFWILLIDDGRWLSTFDITLLSVMALLELVFSTVNKFYVTGFDGDGFECQNYLRIRRRISFDSITGLFDRRSDIALYAPGIRIEADGNEASTAEFLTAAKEAYRRKNGADIPKTERRDPFCGHIRRWESKLFVPVTLFTALTLLLIKMLTDGAVPVEPGQVNEAYWQPEVIAYVLLGLLYAALATWCAATVIVGRNPGKYKRSTVELLFGKKDVIYD